MRRFTSMKVGLVGVLSCLALVVSLFATTGTASAYTANDLRPNINVFDVSRFGDCLEFRIEGIGFTPFHHADLRAAGGVSIDPDRVGVNGNGDFATNAQVCGFGFGGFSNCGDFIDSPDFFCGVNLNPQEFCPLSEFSSDPFCLNLSALRPIKPVSKQDQCSPPVFFCPPSGGSGPTDQGQGEEQGQPQFQQGQGDQQGQPQFHQGQGQGDQQGQPMPPPDQHPHGGSPCELNPELCNPQGQSQDQGSQGQPQDQHPSQPDQPMPPQDQHHGPPPCLEFQQECNPQGGTHGGSRCEVNPELCNPQGQSQDQGSQGQPQDQGPHGHLRCEVNPELCNPQGGPHHGPPCPEFQQECNPFPHHGQLPCPEFQRECNLFPHHGPPPCLEFQPECHFHHFRPPFFFHFHRVRVFEFCRFHFFSFCHFGFRNQIITVFIRAFDEFTGRRSDTAVIRFGFNF